MSPDFVLSKSWILSLEFHILFLFFQLCFFSFKVVAIFARPKQKLYFLKKLYVDHWTDQKFEPQRFF